MKPAIQSQTIVASIISIVAIGSQVFGYAVDINAIGMTLNDIVAMAGAGWAIWGRWKATTPIQGILK